MNNDDSKSDNLVKQICSPLMDDALAACVVTSDGKVAFGFGDTCDFSTNASDAAKIIELIGKLTNLKNERSQI
jgi:hypothetical protein